MRGRASGGRLLRAPLFASVCAVLPSRFVLRGLLPQANLVGGLCGVCVHGGAGWQSVPVKCRVATER